MFCLHNHVLGYVLILSKLGITKTIRNCKENNLIHLSLCMSSAAMVT